MKFFAERFARKKELEELEMVSMPQEEEKDQHERLEEGAQTQEQSLLTPTEVPLNQREEMQLDAEEVMQYLQREQEEKQRAQIQHLEELLQGVENEIGELPAQEFSIFLEEAPQLLATFLFLKELHACYPQLMMAYEWEGFYLKHQSFAAKLEEYRKRSEQMKAEQQRMQQEIEQFRATIEECQQKYRFSLDWNGKRPFLSAHGKKLTEQRTAFLKDEAKLNQEIAALYLRHEELRSEFMQRLDQIQSYLAQKKQALQAWEA